MSDEPQQPAAAWLTYQQAAERLGLPTPTAAAARARRGRWPKRIRNSDNAAEILVPGELLATASKKPAPARQPPVPIPEAPTLADAVRAAVAPLTAALEREETARRALQSQADALRDQLAGAQLEAAKTDAGRQVAEREVKDLAGRLEREEADRKTLQRQADAVRDELSAARIERAQAVGEAATAQAKREAAEARAADLQRQVEALEARQARRRWWWP